MTRYLALLAGYVAAVMKVRFPLVRSAAVRLR
jgi:hypothetical protein